MTAIKNSIKILPNFLTSLNLFCGCLAIFYAFNNNLVYSSYLVLIAALFDFADGFSARLFNAYSEIGKQLDSLADIISFGVAPAAILSVLIRSHLNISEPITEASIFELIQLFFPFLIVIFSGLRLAKFNIDISNSEAFSGLPTPANALLIVSFPLIIESDNYELLSGIINNKLFILLLIPISCYLLISRYPMFGMKIKTFGIKKNLLLYIFLLLSLILLIIFKYSGFPIIIALYILISLVNKWIIKLF